MANEELRITGTFRDRMSSALGKVGKSVRGVGKDFVTFGKVATAPIALPLKAINKLIDGVFTVRNAILGFAAIKVGQSIVSGFENIAASIDDIGKQADRLQVTTESLSALRFGAELSQVKLEDLSAAVADFSKNLEKARKGSREQRDAFHDLGIDIEAIGRQGRIDLVDVFGQAADGLERMSSATQRQTALSLVFGGAGAKLGSLLRGGAAGVKALADEAERLGVVFSPEQIQRAADFQDAMTRFRASLAAVGQQLFLEFAPGFSRAFEEFSRYLAENRKEVVGWASSIATSIGSAASVSIDAIIGLIGLIEKIPGAFQAPDGAAAELELINTQLRVLESSRRIAEQFAKTLEEIGAAQTKVVINGREQIIDVVALDRQESELRERAAALAASIPGGIADGLRAGKARFTRDISLAMAGLLSPSDFSGPLNASFRQILLDAGIRTDQDVIDAVAAKIIPPEALLEGIQRGLFSAGILEKIQAAVAGNVQAAPTTADLRGASSAQRQLADLQRELLALETPTTDVQIAVARLNGELQRLALIDSSADYLTSGAVDAAAMQRALDTLSGAIERNVRQIQRAGETQQLEFEKSVLSMGTQTREIDAQLAQIAGRSQELMFQQAFDDGRISAEQLAEALRVVQDETEKAANRARGDFAQGFADGAHDALKSLTDLTKFGNQAANQLVNEGFEGMITALDEWREGTKSAKEAFEDWGRSMLKILFDLIQRWAILKAIEAIGLTFETGGVMPGQMRPAKGGDLPVRAYAQGGIARTPQVAVFGEGRGAEAFVPLPDGRRIPVDMRGGGGGDIHLHVHALDAKDVSNWFVANRGLILAIQQNGLETMRSQRTSVRRAAN